MHVGHIFQGIQISQIPVKLHFAIQFFVNPSLLLRQHICLLQQWQEMELNCLMDRQT